MNSLQKTGGVAALGMAATWVVAFAIFFGVLFRAGFYDAGADPAERVAILVEHQAIAAMGFLVPWVLWGVLQVVLALALYERLKDGSPALAQVGAAIGLILAGVGIVYGMIAIVGIESAVALYGADPERAGTVWLAVEAVELTKTEILTGLWLLLVSWAAVRARVLPRALNVFGMALGGVGILTVVRVLGLPIFEALVFVFGSAHLVWYVWLGIVMLRTSAGRESRTLAGQVA